MPQTRPRRLVPWLADPAASPLFTAAAAVTAAGWSTAAAVLAATVATGHPETAASGAAGASVFALPAVDLVTGIISLSWRTRALPAPPGTGRAWGRQPGGHAGPPGDGPG